MKTPILEIRIAWTAGAATGSGWIRKADGVEWEGVKYDAAINHVFLHFIFDGATGIPSWIYESAKDGIQPSPLEHLELAMDERRVLRLIELRLPVDAATMDMIWKRAIALHGAGYDWKLLGLYLAWIRIFGRSKTSDWIFRFDNKKRFTCNEFTVRVLEALVAQIPLGTGYTMTPEALFIAFFGMPSAIFVRDHMDGQNVAIVDKWPPPSPVFA